VVIKEFRGQDFGGGISAPLRVISPKPFRRQLHIIDFWVVKSYKPLVFVEVFGSF
jgi:hypothetical protein